MTTKRPSKGAKPDLSPSDEQRLEELRARFFPRALICDNASEPRARAGYPMTKGKVERGLHRKLREALLKGDLLP